jgi:uncharacterized tellurite resistance protein B-like protein
MKTQKDQSIFSAKTALCLAAITLVGIDGEFKEEELEKLREYIRADESAFLKAFELYNSKSLEVCMDTVSLNLSDMQKRATYAILRTLAHADGVVAKEEAALLQRYANNFGFSDNMLSKIQRIPLGTEDLSLFD